MRKLITVAAILLTLVPAAAHTALAQDYPVRTVRIVLNYPAGGAADILTRALAEQLNRKWSQSVVVENRTGAGGNIGAEFVFNSQPDGYTVLATPLSPLSINQWLVKHMPFDPAAFVPVSIFANAPTVLVVNPKLNVDNVRDLIALAAAKPDQIKAATQGIGSTSHLTSELFQMLAQVKFSQIPFRGSAPALQTLLVGDVDLMFDAIGVAQQLAHAGQLRMLAVGTETRLPSLPAVATVAETLPGFESSATMGLFLPPKTPSSIAERLSADVRQALRSPELMQRYRDLSSEPVYGSPTSTAATVADHGRRWKKVIEAAGITAE